MNVPYRYYTPTAWDHHSYTEKSVKKSGYFYMFLSFKAFQITPFSHLTFMPWGVIRHDAMTEVIN